MQTEMVELSRYRMEKATECLADAQDAFEENRLENRSIGRITLFFMRRGQC